MRSSQQSLETSEPNVQNPLPLSSPKLTIPALSDIGPGVANPENRPDSASAAETGSLRPATATTLTSAGGESSLKPSHYQALLESPASYYAVQLLAARKESTIKRYEEQNPHIPTRQVKLITNGTPITILLLGVYPDRAMAEAVLEGLDPAPSEIPWIRSLGPLQALIKRSGN